MTFINSVIFTQDYKAFPEHSCNYKPLIFFLYYVHVCMGVHIYCIVCVM